MSDETYTLEKYLEGQKGMNYIVGQGYSALDTSYHYWRGLLGNGE